METFIIILAGFGVIFLLFILLIIAALSSGGNSGQNSGQYREEWNHEATYMQPQWETPRLERRSVPLWQVVLGFLLLWFTSDS
jgi:hypothetical protein